MTRARRSARGWRRALGLAVLLSVAAPFLAPPATAQNDPRLESLRRVEALALFDLACLGPRPGFADAETAFRAAGLDPVDPASPAALPGVSFARPDGAIAASRASQQGLESCLVVFDGGDLEALGDAVAATLAARYGDVPVRGVAAGLDVWKIPAVATQGAAPVLGGDLFVIVVPPDRNSAARLGVLAQTRRTP